MIYIYHICFLNIYIYDNLGMCDAKHLKHSDVEHRKMEKDWCHVGEKVTIKLVHSLPLSKLQVCFTRMTASHRLL